MMPLRQEPETPRTPLPSIQFFHGSDRVAAWPLADGEQLVAGRVPACDLTVPHDSVSRTHARFLAEDGGVWVEDLGAVNGTWVDGLRVHRRVRLEDGQLVELGRSGEDGYRLRFHDPAVRLLREMGLMAEPETSEGTEDGPAVGLRLLETPADLSEGTGEVPGTTSEMPGAPSDVGEPATREIALGEMPGTPAEGTSTEEAPGTAEGTAEQVPGTAEQQPGTAEQQVPGTSRAARIWGVVALVLVLGASTVAALSFLRPSTVSWRWVQLSPPRVTGGVELLIESPDIRPGHDLAIFFAGQQLLPLSLETGRLQVVIPELEDSPERTALPGTDGRYGLPLWVRQNDMEVFRTRVHYRARPRLDRLVPDAAAVGEEVLLEGSALGHDPGDVDVRVGDLRATVLEATGTRVRFRVPDPEAAEPLALPVELRVASFQVSPATPLTVAPALPEAPEPVRPEPTARPLFRAARAQGGWSLQAPVGPALFFASEGGRHTPVRVRRATAAWNRLFELAAGDPALTIRPRSRDSTAYGREFDPGFGAGRHALIADSPRLAQPLELGTWSGAELRRMTLADGAAASGVPAGLLLSWLADVWSVVLDAAGRGLAPTGAGFLPADFLLAGERLAALRAAHPDAAVNVEWLAGSLGPGEQRALATALGRFPVELADVAGRWQGQVENVFFPGESYRCRLDLDLRRQGGALAGTARLTFTKPGSGIEFSLPEVVVTGAFDDGAAPRLEIVADFAKPAGRLVLAGSFRGSRLHGSFEAVRAGVRAARWRAERARPAASGEWDEPSF